MIDDYTFDFDWMHVYDDTIPSSSDDEAFQGRNGKVLTDREDNIYVYYFKNNPNQAVVLKYNPLGIVVWKRTIENCEPMDMVLMPDGNLLLATRLSALLPWGMVVYKISPVGETDSTEISIQALTTTIPWEIRNATIYPQDDNTLLISGSMVHQYFINVAPTTSGFVIKLSQFLTEEWGLILNNYSIPAYSGVLGNNTTFNQNSIIRTNANKFLMEFSFSKAKPYEDSIPFGLVRGLLNPDGKLDTLYIDNTGYLIQSNGRRHGFINHYCNGLLKDGGKTWFNYSTTEIMTTPGPAIKNAIIEIDDDAKIIDTIPVVLPSGYKIVCYKINKGSFFMTAYKAGIASGTSDFGANQTLFITGDRHWNAARTFTLQKFYSDFFPSIAQTSDGGFICMGKIQSFNNNVNKLVLFKYKGI